MRPTTMPLATTSKSSSFHLPEDRLGEARFQDQCLPDTLQRHLSLPQSSSSSRFTAGAFGFFIFSQSGERPER
jgi:hypothetical protein